MWLNKGLLKNERGEIPHYSDLEVSPACVLHLSLQYILEGSEVLLKICDSASP